AGALGVIPGRTSRARPRRRGAPSRVGLSVSGRISMDIHTAGHRRGVAAAPHRLAAEAGRAILAEGGNALEAMVAMAATIAAVYPHMNHIGGDGFWLMREPPGRARPPMGAGPPGTDAAGAPHPAHGHEKIP